MLCSIQAGCKALPPLLSIRQVMMQRHVAGVWSNKEELPVGSLLSFLSSFSTLMSPCLSRSVSLYVSVVLFSRDRLKDLVVV